MFYLKNAILSVTVKEPTEEYLAFGITVHLIYLYLCLACKHLNFTPHRKRGRYNFLNVPEVRTRAITYSLVLSIFIVSRIPLTVKLARARAISPVIPISRAEAQHPLMTLNGMLDGEGEIDLVNENMLAEFWILGVPAPYSTARYRKWSSS